MKIMCLNSWGGTLYGDLLPYLASAAPDVLCLQEVVHSPLSDKDVLTYRDGDHVLPQRANLFRDVCAALPDHVATFCPAAQGVLWDGDRTVASQWGLATFVHQSLPVIAQAQDFVHKAYSPSGFGDHPRSRNAHAVRVHDPEGDRTVSIAHMHGLRDLRGKMDTPERLAQMLKLLDLSQRVSRPEDFVVVCGDFNVERESRTLDLGRDAGLAELVTGRGFESTRTSHYRKAGKFADYMFVNRESDVVGFDVVYQPEVSDHCPLVLEI